MGLCWFLRDVDGTAGSANGQFAGPATSSSSPTEPCAGSADTSTAPS
jgi:hypothetical protein